MFINVHGFHSLTKRVAKCILWEDNEHDKYAITTDCSNI